MCVECWCDCNIYERYVLKSKSKPGESLCGLCIAFSSFILVFPESVNVFFDATTGGKYRMGLAEATLLSTCYTSILPPFSDSVYSMTIYLQHIYYNKSVCTFYCTEYAMKQMDRFFSFTLSVKSGYLSQDELVDQMDTGGFCFFTKSKKSQTRLTLILCTEERSK